jgi:hypothetical protein
VAAKENLRTHFSVVGLTDRFDETLLLLRKAYGWRNVTYVRRNVAVGRPTVEDLSPATVEAVTRCNRFDLELYRYAQELLERQISQQGPGFATQVRAFRLANWLLPRAIRAYRRMRERSVRVWLRSGKRRIGR